MHPVCHNVCRLDTQTETGNKSWPFNTIRK